MPGMSGYDLVMEVRKKHPFQIIIIISGNPDPENHKLETDQVCLTLNKPFRVDALLSMVRDLIFPCHKHLTTENKKETPSMCVNAKLVNCPFCSQN